MFLAGCEAWITPVVDVSTVVFGAARLTALKAFRKSERNCNLNLSVSWKFFCKLMSQL